MISSGGSAQNLYVYPSAGQSQEQQDRDRYECHDWAVSQTGFDPTRPPPPGAPPPPPPRANALRGAVGGAALGAIGGAIGGNAGTGAAIGAGAGALVGEVRRRNQQSQVDAAHSQQTSVYAQQTDDYNQAVRTCLKGRGYTTN